MNPNVIKQLSDAGCVLWSGELIMSITVNFGNISKSKIVNPAIREIAEYVQSNNGSYYTISDCLAKIKTESLADIIQLMEDSPDKTDEELLLLGMVLNQVEGGTLPEVEDDLYDELSRLMIGARSLLIIESLYRSGLVELKRENMSLDSAASHLPIARVLK